MEYAPRLPFGASLTSWGISTIMIIGSLAISANKRNTSKDKRTVPLSSYSRDLEDGSTEYAIVNRGTKTLSDWVNNFAQVLGWSKDMEDSIERAKYFVNLHCGDEITFVGHSKGGAEATLNAVYTNKNAIIFNPANANFFLAPIGKFTQNITAYAIENEVLTGTLGTMPSPVEYVYLPEPNPVNNWNPIEHMQKDFDNHSIKAVISALRLMGYD